MNHVNYEPSVRFQFQYLFWNPYNILLSPYLIHFYDLNAHLKSKFLDLHDIFLYIIYQKLLKFNPGIRFGDQFQFLWFMALCYQEETVKQQSPKMDDDKLFLFGNDFIANAPNSLRQSLTDLDFTEVTWKTKDDPYIEGQNRHGRILSTKAS